MTADTIRASDLAAAIPAFGTVPPETQLAPMPLPGSQRIFHSSELQALAPRYGVVLSATPDTCFQWPMIALDRGQMVEAMRQALQLPDAQIEIADASTYRVPAGRIEFTVSRMGTPASPEQHAPVLWRGDVVYGGNHRYAIWARVGITAQCQKLVATESLKAGQPITARQLKATSSTCFPSSRNAALSVDEVAGMAPLRAINNGAEVRAEMLSGANDVNRGDVVHIDVRSGATHLALSGRALSAGRSGDTISIRNPDSNKIFQARITGKGTAVVEAGGPKGS